MKPDSNTQTSGSAAITAKIEQMDNNASMSQAAKKSLKRSERRKRSKKGSPKKTTKTEQKDEADDMEEDLSDYEEVQESAVYRQMSSNKENQIEQVDQNVNANGKDLEGGNQEEEKKE